MLEYYIYRSLCCDGDSLGLIAKIYRRNGKSEKKRLDSALLYCRRTAAQELISLTRGRDYGQWPFRYMALYIYFHSLYIYIFFLSSLPVHIYKDIWLHFLYMISLSMLCVVRWRGLIIRYVGWITTLYLLLFLLLPGCFCCWPYGIYIFFCVTWGRMEEEGNVRAVVVVGGGGGEKATPEKASLGPLAVGPTPFFFANQ